MCVRFSPSVPLLLVFGVLPLWSLVGAMGLVRPEESSASRVLIVLCLALSSSALSKKTIEAQTVRRRIA